MTPARLGVLSVCLAFCVLVVSAGIIIDSSISTGYLSNDLGYNHFQTYGFGSEDHLGRGPVVTTRKFASSPTKVVATRYGTSIAIVQQDAYVWGTDTNGLFGMLGMTLSADPQMMDPGVKVVDVAIGEDFGIILSVDARVWVWGSNLHFQFGAASPLSSTSLVEVPNTYWNMLPVSRVFAAQQTAMILLEDGSMFGWGANNGNLLLANNAKDNTPLKLTFPSGRRVQNVAVGEDAAIACASDGYVMYWGYDGGNTATIINRLTNTLLWNTGEFCATPYAHSGVLAYSTTDGRLVAWGDTTNGRLGMSDLTKATSPTQVSFSDTAPTYIAAGCLGASSSYLYVSSTAGTSQNTTYSLLSTGLNTNARLLTSTLENMKQTAFLTSVLPEIASSTVVEVSCHEHILLRTADGSVITWGNSNADPLIGLTADSLPKKTDLRNQFTQPTTYLLSLGSSTASWAVTNGSRGLEFWMWGVYAGSTYSLPRKISLPVSVMSILAVANGQNHFIVLANSSLSVNSVILTAGDNANEQLGRSTSTRSSDLFTFDFVDISSASIPNGLSCDSVQYVAASGSTSWVVCAAGTNKSVVLWWGETEGTSSTASSINYNYDNSARYYATVQAPVVSVSAGAPNNLYLVTDTGLVFGRGLNTMRQLCGIPSLYSWGLVSIPLPTTLPTGVIPITVGAGDRFFLAVFSDNATMGGCGRNDRGMLGAGEADSSVGVGWNMTDTSQLTWHSKIDRISVGQDHVLLLDTENQLWAAGAGTEGQLGTGHLDDSYYLTSVAQDKTSLLFSRRITHFAAGYASMVASEITVFKSSVFVPSSPDLTLSVYGLGQDETKLSMTLRRGANMVSCASISLNANDFKITCTLGLTLVRFAVGDTIYATITNGFETTEEFNASLVVPAAEVTPSYNILPIGTNDVQINGFYFGTDRDQVSVSLFQQRPDGKYIQLTSCEIASISDTLIICAPSEDITTGVLYAQVSRGGGTTATVEVAYMEPAPHLVTVAQVVPWNAPEVTLVGRWFGNDTSDVWVEFNPTEYETIQIVDIIGQNDGALQLVILQMFANVTSATSTDVYAVFYRHGTPSPIALAFAAEAPPSLTTPDVPLRLIQGQTKVQIPGKTFGSQFTRTQVYLQVTTTATAVSKKRATNVTIECFIHNLESSQDQISCHAAIPLPVGPLFVEVVRNNASTGLVYMGDIYEIPTVENASVIIAASVKSFTLHGTAFIPSPNQEDNQVSIGGLPCAVSSATSTEINCTVSSTLPLSNLTAVINLYGGHTQVSYIAFVVPAPSITLSNTEYLFNSTTYRISGQNFANTNETLAAQRVALQMGASTPVPCMFQPEQCTATEIICTIPANTFSEAGSVFAVVFVHGTATPRQQVGVIQSDLSGVARPLAAGIIAAIVVPIIVFVVVAAILVVVFIRKRLTTIENIRMQAIVVPEEMQSMFNIKSSELEIISKLGEGSYGAVYFGKYKGRHVAIKKLAANMISSHVNDFYREASLMLSIKPHRNIVRMLGMCQEMNNFSMVMEFLANGSLDSFVHDALEEGPLDDVTLFRITRGVALGMSALARQGVVHRDLAARNILLDARLEPRVSDFGFSRAVGETSVGKTSSEIGPLKWMPPESIRDKQYSEKSDVWSYGILLYELMTGEEPYADEDDLVSIAVQIRDQGRNPIKDLPDKTPKYIVKTMEMCLKPKPDDRPTFQQICDFLVQYAPTGFVIDDAAAENALVFMDAKTEQRAAKLEKKARSQSKKDLKSIAKAKEKEKSQKADAHVKKSTSKPTYGAISLSGGTAPAKQQDEEAEGEDSSSSSASDHERLSTATYAGLPAQSNEIEMVTLHDS